MIEQPELMHLLVEAINAAIRAGALIMEVYNSDDFQVNLKSDSTPLTLADRKANAEIVNSLMKTRVPVLSEEGRNILYEERKGWEYFWLVDPLDGTKEFIKRNGEFTVNIALIYNEFPIIGVVYVPVSGDLYFAMKDVGSFKQECIFNEFTGNISWSSLVKMSKKLPLVEKRDLYTIVASRSHPSRETDEFIEKMKNVHGNVNLISRGSSLKICMVAEGLADVYPRYGGTTEWDTAAGQAVAECAGCTMNSLESCKRISYNKEDIQNPWFIVKVKEE